MVILGIGRGADVPDAERRRRGLGAWAALRGGDLAELGRAPARRGARGGDPDRDHRHARPGGRLCTRSSTGGCSRARASWPARWRAWGWSSRARAMPGEVADHGLGERARATPADDRRSRERSRRRCRASPSPTGEHASVAAADGRGVPAQRARFRGAVGRDARARSRGSRSDVSLRRDEWLFREGDHADGVYVVRVGHLEVIRDGPDAHETVNTLTRGAVLGELALLSDSHRSASIRALRDTELLQIERTHFDVAAPLRARARAGPDARAERAAAGQSRDPAVPPRAAGDDRAARRRGRSSRAGPRRRAQPRAVHVGPGRGAVSGRDRTGPPRRRMRPREWTSRVQAVAQFGPLVERCELRSRPGGHGVRRRRAYRARGTSSASPAPTACSRVVERTRRRGRHSGGPDGAMARLRGCDLLGYGVSSARKSGGLDRASWRP